MNDSSQQPACELCRHAGGVAVWSDSAWRVIRVEDEAFPAFYRVVSNKHVAEFSQMQPPERERCMVLVNAVESVLIERLLPTKINLASLGNMVVHVHWHVVARFDWDSHFPQPIWGARQRDVSPRAVERLRCGVAELDEAMRSSLNLLQG